MKLSKTTFTIIVGIAIVSIIGAIFVLELDDTSTEIDESFEYSPDLSQDALQEISEKPTSLPQMRLYSDDSPFNQVISPDAKVDPNSQIYVDAIAKTVEKGAMVLQAKRWSTPIYFADANTPRYDVLLSCGPYWELGVTMLKNVPIPDFAEPSNDEDENIVGFIECGGDVESDNPMVIIDLSTGYEYDFWQANKYEGRWGASWGNVISIDSTGVYENGMSTRGSGFAFPAGLVWPHELEQGEIPHALVFNLPDDLVRGGGPVLPATDSDGESNNFAALPEGARLRLDPSLDLGSLDLTPAEMTIARAMQEYGMYLGDRGGSDSLALYAVEPRSVQGNPYAGLLPDEDYPILENIPVDKLQVLELSPQNPDFQEMLELPTNGYAEFQ